MREDTIYAAMLMRELQLDYNMHIYAITMSLLCFTFRHDITIIFVNYYQDIATTPRHTYESAHACLHAHFTSTRLSLLMATPFAYAHTP